MDLRKVIKLGKATYSITLPKEWVVDNNVEKGDVLKVEKLSKNTLEVSPNKDKEEVEIKEINIQADDKEHEDIFREVVAAYIKGYTIINIKGDIKGKIRELRQKLQELIGLEIMEVSSKGLKAKSFLDVTETSVEKTIRRVFYITKSMSKEFKESVEKGGSIDEILELDREVNRNTFFILKYLFKSLDDPKVAEKIGMKNYEIFFTWELIKQLEAISDKIKMMADIASNKEILIKKDAMNEFLNIYEEVEQNFFFAIEEYFKKNKENVHEIFKKVDENEEICNEFLNDYKKAYTPLLVDHLKDINMFTRSIAELIVDFE